MGGWFPRNDRPSERDLYCASILALLKPRTDLSEIKADSESFEQSFASFINGVLKRTLDIIKNIQYYYECYDGAKRRQEAQATGQETEGGIEYQDERGHDDLTTNLLDFPAETVDVTEEDIDLAYKTRGMMRERLYTEITLNTATEHGVFPKTVPLTTFWPMVERAHPEDLKTFLAWEEQLKTVCRREVDEGGPTMFSNVNTAGPPPEVILKEQVAEPQSRGDLNTTQGAMLHRPKKNLLKGDQQHMHDIIERQLLRWIAGKSLYTPLSSHMRRNL